MPWAGTLRRSAPSKRDLAARRLVDAGDDVEERRLAGAVRPDQPTDLADLDREGQLVQRHDAAEADAHLADVENRQRITTPLVGAPLALLRVRRTVAALLLAPSRPGRPAGRHRSALRGGPAIGLPDGRAPTRSRSLPEGGADLAGSDGRAAARGRVGRGTVRGAVGRGLGLGRGLPRSERRRGARSPRGRPSVAAAQVRRGLRHDQLAGGARRSGPADELPAGLQRRGAALRRPPGRRAATDVDGPDRPHHRHVRLA